MSSVRYTNLMDDDDDDMIQLTPTQIVFQQMMTRGRHWPTTIGVVQIILGFVLTMLGVLEMFIIPMMESKDGTSLIVFDKGNCYGAGFFAGIVMVITGSTAIRASLSKRNTTTLRFYNMTIVSLLIYGILSVILIVGYGLGWTESDKYMEGSHLREIHMFVTICTVLGLMFAMSGFVQYFDVMCCGDTPLWMQWVKCFCFCCYHKRRLSFERILREEQDDRNNPV